MAKEPEREKPKARRPLTGTAQPVTNSVERAREHFKGHAEPAAPASKKRKTVRARKPDVEEPSSEPEPEMPEGEG